MAVNCGTCRHYQAFIVAKYGRDNVDGALPCLVCADFKHRKSFYEPIERVPGDKQKGFPFGPVPGP
ncbi:hypothetical protein ES707_09531 [subsurface metagenome]